MPDANIDKKELRALVVLAKTKPLAFAYCPGSKKELLFLLDKKAKPKALNLIAKKDGPGKKVAFGTFAVVDGVVTLTCEKPLSNMAKILCKYLKAQKISLGVKILDSEGSILQSEDEPLHETEADGDAGAAVTPVLPPVLLPMLLPKVATLILLQGLSHGSKP